MGLVGALALVAIGCGDLDDGERAGSPDVEDDEVKLPGGGGEAPEVETPFEYVRCHEQRWPLPALQEDRRVYDQDELGVWTLQLMVEDLEGFEAVNAGIEGAEVDAMFVEAAAPAVYAPNARLRIRGHSSRRNAQKNFKVELEDGLWRGQKEINLNKHMYDLTRVRNKLAFDVLETVPHLTSLRTQFVHLHINGEDFGLYTWVEEADRRFLRSHGLDPDGQLYKAARFHFQELDDEVWADPTVLRTHVEPKANADPDKLRQMIDAVHDDALAPGALVDRYFERDNLVTWLAFNVLVNNTDTRTQNYYLYSPASCDGWYFLPWDHDGAWDFDQQGGAQDDRERWESGLSNWWPMYLMKRVYADPAIAAAVEARVAELAAGALSDEVTAAELARYRDLVAPFIAALPDRPYLSGVDDDDPPEVAIAVWQAELDRITTTTSRFAAEYLEVIERPMPVHLSASVDDDGEVELRWSASFDLQGDAIAYDVEVARDAAFADLVAERRGVEGRSVTIAGLAPGTYAWRVVIRDAGGAWQLPFDPYEEVVVE